MHNQQVGLIRIETLAEIIVAAFNILRLSKEMDKRIPAGQMHEAFSPS